MKYLIIFSLIIQSVFGMDIYELSIENSKGEEIKFKDYKGKTILVTNIATKCGYTPQLDALEKLSKKYLKSLVVIGVPSNEFGGQTPESDEKVAEFCRLNYGVSFPLTKKVLVKGPKKHKLFTFLVNDGEEIKWNFEKFLIGKDGNLLGRFPSSTDPLSDQIVSKLEKQD